jgi:hypothetical protein
VDNELLRASAHITSDSTISANALLSIAILAEAAKEAKQDQRHSMEGARRSLCALRRVRRIEFSGDASQTYALSINNYDAVVTNAVSDLLLALEFQKAGWSRQETDQYLLTWNGIVPRASVASRVDQERAAHRRASY